MTVIVFVAFICKPNTITTNRIRKIYLTSQCFIRWRVTFCSISFHLDAKTPRLTIGKQHNVTLLAAVCIISFKCFS